MGLIEQQKANECEGEEEGGGKAKGRGFNRIKGQGVVLEASEREEEKTGGLTEEGKEWTVKE